MTHQKIPSKYLQHILPNMLPLGSRGYRCDRLLRTRIGSITGVPRAKAEKYLAVPVEMTGSQRKPASLGDPMDLQPGESLGERVQRNKMKRVPDLTFNIFHNTFQYCNFTVTCLVPCRIELEYIIRIDFGKAGAFTYLSGTPLSLKERWQKSTFKGLNG